MKFWKFSFLNFSFNLNTCAPKARAIIGILLRFSSLSSALKYEKNLFWCLGKLFLILKLAWLAKTKQYNPDSIVLLFFSFLHLLFDIIFRGDTPLFYFIQSYEYMLTFIHYLKYHQLLQYRYSSGKESMRKYELWRFETFGRWETEALQFYCSSKGSNHASLCYRINYLVPSNNRLALDYLHCHFFKCARLPEVLSYFIGITGDKVVFMD